MSKKLTDEETEFLAEIAAKYYDMLEKYCGRCVSYNPKYMSMIPDLIQETFLKAVENASVLRQHENIPGWLKKSCHFSLLNTLRSIRMSREVLYPAIDKLRQLELAHGENENVWNDKITLKEVLTAVQSVLSEDEQIIFNDYFLDNLSTAETARRNNLTYDTVRGRISRIRKKLKAYFRYQAN